MIDLGNGLSPLVQHLAPSFNEMIVVVEPFLNSLHHSQALIDDLSIICDGKIGIYVVVNYRQRSDTPALSVLQIQSNFRTPVEISLMPAPELYQMASRRHMIASQITLDSSTYLQFQNLAEKVVIRSNRTVIS